MIKKYFFMSTYDDVPVDDHINCISEQARRQNWGIKKVPLRLSHRCLSVMTITAIEPPIARVVRSMALLSSFIASGANPSTISKSFSKLAWLACMNAMMCRDAPA